MNVTEPNPVPAPQNGLEPIKPAATIKPESKLIRALKNIPPFTYFFAAVLTISLIALAYFMLQNLSLKSQMGMNSFRLPWANATCTYQGQEFKPGESVPSVDGCNSCSCGENGQVACTLMACSSDKEVVLDLTANWKTYASPGYSFMYPGNLFIDPEIDKEIVGSWVKDTRTVDSFELTAFDRAEFPNITHQCFRTDRSPEDQAKECLPAVISIIIEDFNKSEYPTLQSVYELPHIQNTIEIDKLQVYKDNSNKSWNRVIAVTTPETRGFSLFYESEASIYSINIFKEFWGYRQYANQSIRSPGLMHEQESLYIDAEMEKSLDPIIDRILSTFQFIN